MSKNVGSVTASNLNGKMAADIQQMHRAMSFTSWGNRYSIYKSLGKSNQ